MKKKKKFNNLKATIKLPNKLKIILNLVIVLSA